MHTQVAHHLSKRHRTRSGSDCGAVNSRNRDTRLIKQRYTHLTTHLSLSVTLKSFRQGFTLEQTRNARKGNWHWSDSKALQQSMDLMNWSTSQPAIWKWQSAWCVWNSKENIKFSVYARFDISLSSGLCQLQASPHLKTSHSNCFLCRAPRVASEHLTSQGEQVTPTEKYG